EPLDTYNAQQGLLDEQVATSVNALDELMAE
ncbi:sensor TorS domain protein, partial [Vibrio parahaemolyticus V-223/04]